jgi:tRNA-splicing ligase RtcB
MIEIKGKYTTAFLTINEFEEQLINQANNMTNHIAFDNKIVLMPDAHSGRGVCVGFSMLLNTKIIPNICGSDIGCGVLSVNIGKELNMSLKDIDDKIRENVPTGINVHEKSFKFNSNEKFSFSKNFPWEELNDELLAFIRANNIKFGTNYAFIKKYDYRDFGALCNKIGMKPNKAEMSIGTMGSSNHLIEISKSLKGNDFWITVHSGSRNLGKCICEYHQKKAKKILDDKRNNILKNRIKEITESVNDNTKIPFLIVDAKKELGLDFEFDIKDMEFLEGDFAFEYLIDMIVSQKYAQLNRKMMINIICEALGGIKQIDSIESIHNYIDFRDFIIRKGAIRSYVGEKMVIPLNMKEGILICEGKSNSDWNYSAPHGAGRCMSRAKAKERLNLEDFKKDMEGIYSSSIQHNTLDESPGSYKNADMIISAIEPTATIIDRLKPILNIKDKNSGPTFKERKEEKKRNLERQARRELKEKNR